MNLAADDDADLAAPSSPSPPTSSWTAPPAIELDHVSRWYGQVLGLQDVTLRVHGGVVGLLGPNGAGKSTLLRLLAGIIRPSRGRALVFGRDAHDDRAARRRIGYCPEHEGVWDDLTAREFVTLLGQLSGLSTRDARRRAEETLVELGLSAAIDRRLGGFSKGMRQRTKLAATLTHDPDLILLDEPLTGCDPLARMSIVAKTRALAQAGKTIVLSSHVLHEVEALTQEIVLIHRGQVLAEGNVHRVRELIDEHPHRVRVECDRPRELAARLLVADHVTRVEVDAGACLLETRAPDRLYDELPRAALALGVRVSRLTSPDDNLAAVFEYLTAAKGPTRR